MRFFVGTSGYGYKEWRGKFYPQKFPESQMLGFYARHFPSVEINQTFRQMPVPEKLAAWAREVPGDFRFVLKAPQRITHIKRLKGVEADTAELVRVAGALQRRKGPLFFQLPPNFKKDVPRLDAFLCLLGKRTRAAFEFRHETWFDEETFACLRRYKCALCIADADDLPPTPLVATADFGYLRLRREDYDRRALRRWLTNIRKQKWKDVYVFFRHEETASGPRLATMLLELSAEEA